MPVVLSMAAPTPLPRYVYKIVPSAPPEPMPEHYPLSELDQKDGFVHLSTSWQVRDIESNAAVSRPRADSRAEPQIPITSALFFTHSTEIWVLKIRLRRFEHLLKWDEVEGTNGCPHLYGNFGAADVEAAKSFVRAVETEQSWADVFRSEGAWLE